jgi:hypothetical protein
MESVRDIIKRRDRKTDADVDEDFAELAIVPADGTDPEEALAEVFGLEPDYFFDDEVWKTVAENVDL